MCCPQIEYMTFISQGILCMQLKQKSIFLSLLWCKPIVQDMQKRRKKEKSAVTTSSTWRASPKQVSSGIEDSNSPPCFSYIYQLEMNGYSYLDYLESVGSELWLPGGVYHTALLIPLGSVVLVSRLSVHMSTEVEAWWSSFKGHYNIQHGAFFTFLTGYMIVISQDNPPGDSGLLLYYFWTSRRKGIFMVPQIFYKNIFIGLQNVKRNEGDSKCCPHFIKRLYAHTIYTQTSYYINCNACCLTCFSLQLLQDLWSICSYRKTDTININKETTIIQKLMNIC